MDLLTICALIGTGVLVLLSFFQIALMAGAPIAKYAWGGQHRVLPLKLRVSSGISIILYILFGIFILSKSNLVSIITNQPILDIGMWIITVYFLLGIALNALSKSKSERLVMTPVAACLAVTFLIVAAA